MTVIAAIAAVSPASPAPVVGGKDVAEGFDALLAVATAGEAPASPAVSGQSKGGAAQQSGTDAAVDEEAAAALASGQTDAAALAAATLVAAMVPPTQQTFAALDVEAEVVVASVPDLAVTVSSPDDAALAAAAVGQDVSAIADTPNPAEALLVPAPAEAANQFDAPVAATPLPAGSSPIADPRAAAGALEGALAAAGLDLPAEAVLTTPVAEADPGLEAVAVAQATAAQLARSPVTAASANLAQAAPALEPPVAPAAPVSTTPVAASLPPVVATPVADAPVPAPVVQAVVQASVQAAADPAIKVAMSTVSTEVEAIASPDENPVKIAGVAVSTIAGAAGDPSSGGSLDDNGQHDANSAADAGAMVSAEGVETTDASILTPTSTSAAPLATETRALASARAETRGSPETVAQLSAEILRKLDAQTTRFDVALTPEGLGAVDVRIEIGRNGDLSASMAFDTAQAAAELRSRSQELRQALAQAGFTVADNALRFDVSSQGGQQGQSGFFNFNGGDDGRRAWSGKAFQAAQIDDTPILSVSDLVPGLRMAPDSGLDIRI